MTDRLLERVAERYEKGTIEILDNPALAVVRAVFRAAVAEGIEEAGRDDFTPKQFEAAQPADSEGIRRVREQVAAIDAKHETVESVVVNLNVLRELLRAAQPADGALRHNMNLVARITEYLGSGGFFNPEAMEHDKVRELLMDCRRALAAQTQEKP